MVDTYLQEVRLLTRIVKVQPEHAAKLGISEELLDRLSSDGAHVDLKGYITLSEASRKYELYKATISEWVKKGHLGKVIRTRNELFILEERIAEIAQARKKKGGKGYHQIEKLIVSVSQ